MILVTGADGIVGRSLCAFLAASNLCFVPLVRRFREGVTLPNAEVINLLEINEKDFFKFKDVTFIVHLAAAVPHSAYYPDSREISDLTRRMDIKVSLLQAKLGVPMIYMSTCGLYDRRLDRLKYEDDSDAIVPESPYFYAKLEGEKLFLNTNNATILRLAAPVGPGLKPSVVLSKFIGIARLNKTIELWGSGHREQNFIDVEDVSRLIQKVIYNPCATILNVASDKPTTMLELAQVVVGVVGRGSYGLVSNIDPRDGEKSAYSIDRAKKIYDWYPDVDISTSCRKIINENFSNN